VLLKLDTEKKLLNDLKNKSKIYSNEIDLHKDTVAKVQKFACHMKKNILWHSSYQMRILQSLI